MSKNILKQPIIWFCFHNHEFQFSCVLWGHIPAAEYRKVIIGLIFLRYISCVFEKKYKQLVEEGEYSDIK